MKTKKPPLKRRRKAMVGEHEKAGLKARLGAYQAGQGPASFVLEKIGTG
jgi:hypothetical protein